MSGYHTTRLIRLGPLPYFWIKAVCALWGGITGIRIGIHSVGERISHLVRTTNRTLAYLRLFLIYLIITYMSSPPTMAQTTEIPTLAPVDRSALLLSGSTGQVR